MVNWEIGQKVYCLLRGWGKVDNITPAHVFVKFPMERHYYYKDGRSSNLHVNPSLHVAQPKVQGYEQPPFVDVQPGDQVCVEWDNYAAILTARTVDPEKLTSDKGHLFYKNSIKAIHRLNTIWKA